MLKRVHNIQQFIYCRIQMITTDQKKPEEGNKWAFMIDTNLNLATSGCCRWRYVCVCVCVRRTKSWHRWAHLCPQNYKSEYIAWLGTGSPTQGQREGQLSPPRYECARTHAHTHFAVFTIHIFAARPNQISTSLWKWQTFGQQINEIPLPDKCRLLSVKQNQQQCSWDKLL